MKRKKETPEQNNFVYVARQAIFDVDMEVYAYELLYRDSNVNSANVIDDNQATSMLIINSFIEFGIESITNNKLAFINLTRDYLIGKIPLPFESDKVVLEVLEDIEADPECLKGLKKLVKQGFKIALDDFVVSEENYGLIEFASIIKIDVLALTESELRQEVMSLESFPGKLLAEKIETKEQFNLCKYLGFEYFQGYFFCLPTVISGKELPVNQVKILDIIAKLQDPNCDFDEIEAIINTDVTISYKLLKIINSPVYGQLTKVNSIKEALVLVGLKTLKDWITLLCFSQTDDKPIELIKLSLVRAKMCEELAPHFHVDEKPAFTIGLFSLLDALMDQPIDVLLNNLPLSEEIVVGLTRASGEGGKLGNLLGVVEAYEKGDWSVIPQTVKSSVNLSESYLRAVKWAEELSCNIS